MNEGEKSVLVGAIEGFEALALGLGVLAKEMRERLGEMDERDADPRLRGLEALPSYATIKAVAAVLGVHPNTVAARVKDGTYRADYVGERSVRIHRASVVAALKKSVYVVRR